MNTTTNQANPLSNSPTVTPTVTPSPGSSPTPASTAFSSPSPAPTPSARVTVEIPNSNIPFNPFDPTWVKLWEQVGPISYLAMLCLLIWLLTRLVETVKGK